MIFGLDVYSPLQAELLFGGICFLFIGLLVIAILLAVWVYRDAEKRGMGGVLWLIVVLIAGILGLIIYLIVRRSHPVMAAPPGPGMPPGGFAPPPQ